MTTILITGGTGLIGRTLGRMLKERGYNVAVLSRSKIQDNSFLSYFWDPDKDEIDKAAVESADCIIHLAGANIGDKRWTAKRRQLIIDSRVKTGELIFQSAAAKPTRLRTFISASATGYYGMITSSRICQETDPAADDFLGQTCRQWEDTADRFNSLGVRTVKIRSGVVLTPRGGILDKMMIPFRLGIGSAIGGGNQYVPWIHITDLCGIYIRAIEDLNMQGAYNAVAPDHRTNKDFLRTLARMLHKPFWFPAIPAIAMKILFGRMSGMLLQGSRVSSEKIRSAGYSFLYPDLESALADLTKSLLSWTDGSGSVVK